MRTFFSLLSRGHVFAFYGTAVSSLKVAIWDRDLRDCVTLKEKIAGKEYLDPRVVLQLLKNKL